MDAFNGKVIVVTGASGNLGSAVCRGFADDGGTVALVDLNQERMDAVIQTLHGDGHHGFTADLSNAESAQALVSAIVAHFGKIDVLVHTVGGFAMGTPVHETAPTLFEKMFHLNVMPFVHVGGAVAKQLIAQGNGGKIVVVLAKSGMKGIKNQGAYTASKAAATRIMESMALELKAYNIAVNGVSPSIIDTPANRESMPSADFSQWVTPQQLANSIRFLASEQSGIYGTNLEVFGKG